MNREERIINVVKNLNDNKEFTYEWFERQAVKGRFSTRNLSQIRDIFEITEEVYPGKWDIIIVNTSSHRFNFLPILIIKFDEITVVNRDERQCKIYDLYVKIEFKIATNLFIDKMHGARGTFTAAQHTSGYTWSHLTRHNPATSIRWSSFCYGSGGLVDVINSLATNWLSDLYRFFLLELQTYLEYESLEGGPYARMENVNNKDYSCYSNINIKELELIVDKLYTVLTPEDIDISIVNNDIQINREIITNAIVKIVDDKYKVKLDEKGVPYMPYKMENYNPMSSSTCITYKKEKIELNIIDDIEQENIPDTPHPKLVNLICEMLEMKMRNKLILEMS